MRYGMVEQGNSNLHASLLMPEHAMATVFLWHSLSYNIHQYVVCLAMCYLIHVPGLRRSTLNNTSAGPNVLRID